MLNGVDEARVTVLPGMTVPVLVPSGFHTGVRASKEYEYSIVAVAMGGQDDQRSGFHPSRRIDDEAMLDDRGIDGLAHRWQRQCRSAMSFCQPTP